jgi:hypothetical protein
MSAPPHAKAFCITFSSLVITSEARQSRSQTHKYHHRGLKQFCSVPGKELQEYEYISMLFGAAMDKIGQILKDSKMALISNINTLGNRATVPGGNLCPISLPFCCLGGDIYEFVT